jgi:peptidoglycan/LPS O-acetylase OafA/YrhL
VSSTPDRTQHDFRPDIQGLRAVAVVLVMLFHVWPRLVPGGYVGVDVFFVISGFLITGLLIREVERTGRLSISNFYARRVRRLLPAATFVLICVGLASPFFLPIIRWEDTAAELIASAFYFENILLYSKAIDYLAQDEALSPVQHYWSLSIEEQYYIVWPLLIALCALSFQAKRHWQMALLGLGVAIFALSLAHSFLLTRADPPAAYFATTTRLWEFALGGLIAFLMAWARPAPRAADRDGKGANWRRWTGLGLTWLGIAGIVAAALLYSNMTPFPGLTALLPTLATAALIVGGATALFGYSSPLLSLRPFQYLGDISYSLYLWHWPLIVFTALALDRELTIVDGAAVIALSIALAHATKVLVEDPMRYRIGERGLAGTLKISGAFTAVLVAVALTQYAYIWDRKRDLIAEAGSDESHPGALAFLGAADPSENLGVEFKPSLLRAKKDVPALYADGCHVSKRNAKPRPCTYGDEAGTKLVVLVGDSHAAQWLPALQALATRRHWKIITETKSSCAFMDVERGIGVAADACREWKMRVLNDLIAMRPDIVVTALFVGSGHVRTKEQFKRTTEGLRKTWRKLAEAGIQVVAIRPTPHVLIDVPDCLSKYGQDTKKCTQPRQKVLMQDPVTVAAKGAKGVVLADMTDAICARDRCEPIVGNVLVYRDGHHLTATYSASLAPFLDRFIEKALKQREVRAGAP